MKYKDNEKFSNELKIFLNFIENTLSKELPTPIISMEYFVLGFLEKKDTFAYKVLNNYLTTHAINTIHDTYFDMLNKKAITIVKPNREIKYDEKSVTLLEAAEKEAGEDKVTTIHLLLSFLNETLPNNSVKKVFNHAGVDYKCVLSKKDSFLTEMNSPTAGTTDGNTLSTRKVEVLGVGSLSDLLSIAGGEGMKTVKKGTLDNYCTDISQLVKERSVDDIIGRDDELAEMIKTLSRRKKNNVIIIGDSGVGKTSMVHGLAYLIEKHKVPTSLIGKRILQLNPTTLVAGTQWRGMLEERLNTIVNELKKNKNTILFIDDIAQVFAEKSSIEKDSGNVWNTILENGDIQVIATSDFKGIKSVFSSNPLFKRRFQKLMIDTPSIEDTVIILNSLKKTYEKYHGVQYSDEVIKVCVTLADKYLTEKKLPDSAIDVMDEIGAEMHVKHTTSKELEDLYAKKQTHEFNVTTNKMCDNFESAEKEEELLKQTIIEIDKIEKNLKSKLSKHPVEISVDDVLDMFSRSTHIPVTQLSSNDKSSLINLSNELKKDIIGQDEAIDKICNAIKRNRVGLSKTATYGNFLLIGESGVGKTFLAKKIAKQLFGDEKKMVRFDLSEYSDKTSSNKMIGSNPGYVGYEQGGLLTEEIKNMKHCVLLLDEIEKADNDIFNLFLQVFDEGFLTDNTGEKIDFKNVIILATSNIGTKTANAFGKGIGFNENTEKNRKNILNKELKKKFAPEFLNRFNDIIYFNKLTEDNLKTIIGNKIDEYRESVLEKYNINVVYYDCVIDYILNYISDEKEFGARPIARAIETEILDKISDAILNAEDNIKECIFTVDENDELQMRVSYSTDFISEKLYKEHE